MVEKVLAQLTCLESGQVEIPPVPPRQRKKSPSPEMTRSQWVLLSRLILPLGLSFLSWDSVGLYYVSCARRTTKGVYVNQFHYNEGKVEGADGSGLGSQLLGKSRQEDH